jgi:Bacterial regulatory proteins, luxR family
VAVVSRSAMTADESHEAWLAVFAAVTAPPADNRRAACPNCGHFDVRFQYVADAASRIGFCALWCENCRHGHVLSRVRVPEHLDFLPLDAPDDQIRAAIPEFWDATAAGPATTGANRHAPVVERLAKLRPHVAEYELLKALENPGEIERHLLSRRETEVASLLKRGLDPPAIAKELGLSRSTVQTLIQRIYWKLGRDAGEPLRRIRR